MEHINLAEIFTEIKEFKNIDRETLANILENSFRTLLIKKFGTDKNFDIIINPDKGDLEIWRNRTIVADNELEDKNTQISLSDARKIEPDFEIGEEVAEPVSLKEFGRRAIQTLKQTLVNKILQHEKEKVYKKYKDSIGEIVVGEVYQVRKKEIFVIDDEGNELILPKNEQIPSDFFKKGDTVRAVIKEVKFQGANPLIILSRTSPVFLERLFELEVPEIMDGLITIKNIVREPGERAKVAVESYDERIDPVGACVGIKGSRIHGIVRELRNENIDVINYTDNKALYISRALSPAKISSMKINEKEKKVEVFLKPDQVSLAIGRGGYNIKLAGRLTGYEIDVYREIDENEEDVVLDEFRDEIEDDVIDKLKSIGLDTAKSVLELTPDEIIKRTGLDETIVLDLIDVLKSEFEEDENNFEFK